MPFARACLQTVLGYGACVQAGLAAKLDRMRFKVVYGAGGEDWGVYFDTTDPSTSVYMPEEARVAFLMLKDAIYPKLPLHNLDFPVLEDAHDW